MLIYTCQPVLQAPHGSRAVGFLLGTQLYFHARGWCLYICLYTQKTQIHVLAFFMKVGLGAEGGT
jgi:hypothetical protein